MTFWNVVWAVIVGNVITTIIGLTITFLATWNPKPRYKRPRQGGTAKEVQRAWDAAISDDPDHIDSLIAAELNHDDREYAAWRHEGEWEE